MWFRIRRGRVTAINSRWDSEKQRSRDEHVATWGEEDTAETIAARLEHLSEDSAKAILSQWHDHRSVTKVDRERDTIQRGPDLIGELEQLIRRSEAEISEDTADRYRAILRDLVRTIDERMPLAEGGVSLAEGWRLEGESRALMETIARFGRPHRRDD